MFGMEPNPQLEQLFLSAIMTRVIISYKNTEGWWGGRSGGRGEVVWGTGKVFRGSHYTGTDLVFAHSRLLNGCVQL